jgi:DUF1365 family protein
MFLIDLDEIELLSKKIKLFSYNRFNFFSLYPHEHYTSDDTEQMDKKSIKSSILNFVKQHDESLHPLKIKLLTNLNVLGYNFNPVSFYFCYGVEELPICAIAEVGNTFGEQKCYFLDKRNYEDAVFHLETTKYFYVSPFTDHDDHFDFRLTVPGNKLNLKIDTIRGDDRYFVSTLTGERKTLTNARIIWYALRFPLITLRIIFLIHWNALLLWLKGLSYHKKNAHPELQKDIYKIGKNTPYRSDLKNKKVS